MAQHGGLLETKLSFYNSVTCFLQLVSALKELGPDLGVLEIGNSKEALISWTEEQLLKLKCGFE